MAKRESTEVAPVSGSVPAVPDFMKKYAGQGTEKLQSRDIALPFIRLTQATSPQVAEHGITPGHYWHTLAERDLGKEVRVVGIFSDARAILWRPREAGGGILARSDDLQRWTPSNAVFEVPINKNTKTVKWATRGSVDESRLLEWGTFDPDDPKSPPAGTYMYNMVVCLPDYKDLPPAVISMQRASIRVARKLFGKLKMTAAPMYGIYLKMRSVTETGQGQTFYNYKFEMDGFVESQAEFDKYQEWYHIFSKQGINIKEEDLQPEDTQAAASNEKSEY